MSWTSCFASIFRRRLDRELDDEFVPRRLVLEEIAGDVQRHFGKQLSLETVEINASHRAPAIGQTGAALARQ